MTPEATPPAAQPPIDPAVAVRLRERGIQVAAEARGHTMLVRGDCMTLVERTGSGFGSIGGTGMMTARGLAFLVWRDGRAYLAAKGLQAEADPSQVEAIRAFSADVKFALG